MARIIQNQKTGEKRILVNNEWKPFNEEDFQREYGFLSREIGLDPNPDAPEHKYDYRTALASGANPLESKDNHWPSEFKQPDHPNRYVKKGDGVIDTITGKPARVIEHPETKERMYLDEWRNEWVPFRAPRAERLKKGVSGALKSAETGLMAGTLDLGSFVGTQLQRQGARMQDIPQAQVSREGHPRPGLRPATVQALREKGLRRAKKQGEFIEGVGRETAEFWSKQAEKFAPPESIRGKTMSLELVKKPEYWIYNTFRTAPSMAASMLPAGASYKAITVGGKAIKLSPVVIKRLAKLGAAITGGVIGGKLESSQTYQEILKETGDKQEAAQAADMMFLFSAGLNAISVGKMFSKAGPGFMRRIADAGISGAVEGLTEGAEEPAEVVAKIGARILSGKKVPKNIKELFWQSLKEAGTVAPIAAVTGFAGGAMAGPSSDLEISEKPSKEAETKNQFYEDLVKKDATVDELKSIQPHVGSEQAKAIGKAISKYESEKQEGIEPAKDLFPQQTPQEQAQMERDIIAQRAKKKEAPTGKVPGQEVDTEKQKQEAAQIEAKKRISALAPIWDSLSEKERDVATELIAPIKTEIAVEEGRKAKEADRPFRRDLAWRAVEAGRKLQEAERLGIDISQEQKDELNGVIQEYQNSLKQKPAAREEFTETGRWAEPIEEGASKELGAPRETFAEQVRKTPQILTDLSTTDRRDVTHPYGRLEERRLGEDRRTDLKKRKRIDEMTIEEARVELKKDPSGLTNLMGKRGYEESVKKPVQIMFDLDGLGLINDYAKGGHETGNAALTLFGEAIEQSSLGPDGTHFSGDEFGSQADTTEAVDQGKAEMRDFLTKNPMDITLDGEEYSLVLSFSTGTGGTLQDADQSLITRKREKEAAGIRPKKGTGLAGVTPKAGKRLKADIYTLPGQRTAQPAEGITPSPAAQKPVEQAQESEKAKEPWEMTPKEWEVSFNGIFGLGGRVADRISHRRGRVLKPTKEDIRDAAEFWDVTQTDARKALDVYNYGHTYDKFPIINWKRYHKKYVQQALSENKPVPQEVLKDYPDLAEKVGKSTTAQEAPEQIKQGDQVKYGRGKYTVVEFDENNTRAIIENKDGERVVDVADLSPWQAKEAQQPRKKKARVTLSNVEIKKTLKSETGSTQLITDVVNIFARDQTKSPNFKRWFGDSKVVDENGKPLVVYHGTLSVFEKFDKEKIGETFRADEKGFFFTDNPKWASDYATSTSYGMPAEGGSVIPAYLALKNPLTIDNIWLKKQGMGDTFEREDPISFWDNFQFFALEESDKINADGIIIDDGDNKLFVAFEPTQIKSAIGNTGKFDPNNPSIIGESQLITDIAYHGARIIREGAESFGKFARAMRSQFKDVWDKIKAHMRALYDALKASFPDLKSERGSTPEFEGKRKPELTKRQQELINRYITKPVIKEQAKDDLSRQYLEKASALERPFNDFMYWVVDKNRPIETIQRRLSNVTDEIDVFLKETQRPKVTAARIKKAWDDEIKPMLTKMAQKKVGVAELEEYAHAKHAQEANKSLREANARRYLDSLLNLVPKKESAHFRKMLEQGEHYGAESPAENLKNLNEAFKLFGKNNKVAALKEKWGSFSEKPSGMSDAEAIKILERNKDNKDIEQIRLLLADINNNRLEIIRDAGLIAEEEYNALKNKYKYYVPLYREGFDDVIGGTGRGLSPAGRPIKTRGGSTKQVINILANSISNYEKAINLATKAQSQGALLELVKQNPNPDLWTINKEKKVPRHDSNGNLRMYPDLFTVGKNEFRFMVDGKQYLLEVNSKDKDAMLMLRALKAEDAQLGVVLNSLAKFNQILARVNTSWSPEFILSNFIRDLQTAGINIKDTGVEGKSMFKGAIQSAKIIYNVERGKPTGSELEGYYERFKAAGGKIGWADVHGSIEKLSKKLTREIEMQAGKRPTRKTITEFINWVEDANTSIENGVRLHTFKLAVEQGFSDERAAQIASDLTVDFTRKGAAGPVINSLYLFANAGIQGSYRIFRAAAKSKSVRRSLAGVMGIGFLSGLLNSLAGTDDDGEDYFNKIDDFIRERNAIFMIPGMKGKYIKIPLPWGYNFVWNVGVEASRAFTKDQYSPMKGAMRLAGTFADAFNPVASGTLLQTISPTVFDLIAQVAENKNWFGGELMPKPNKFEKVPTPDSQRYWKSARTPSVWVARQLNSLTGGDKVKPGKIDVSPETLDLLVDTIGGSALKFFTDIGSMPVSMIKNEKVHIHKIPFVRRVFGEQNEWSDSKLYFQNTQEILTAQEQLKAYRGTDYHDQLQADTSKQRRMFAITKRIESRLKRLRSLRKIAEINGKKDRVDKINEQIKNIQRKFNKQYRDILKGK